MYKHKFPNDYCQLSMKLIAIQCYLYLKANPQGIVEIQSFVTDLTFFLLCRGIDGTKYEMSEWLSFPLWVQGHELVLWVQPICLSVCLSVWSVYFCLCTQMAGLAIWVHTFSFGVSKLGTGFLARLFQVQSYVSACLFKCPQSYKKLSCYTFGFRFASFLKSSSCLLISLIMNIFAWMVSHEEIQGALWFWDLTLSKF